MLMSDEVNLASGLPPFANETNKTLDREIKITESKLARIMATYEDQVNRAAAMEEHKKNVEQEILHTQALFDARNREIETESHMKQLAEREYGRISSDMARIEKEIAEVTDQINVLQGNIYKGTEKIEDIRNKLNLGKKEMEEWLRVQQEKEEDNLAIQKYTKADEAKIKELSLQIERLMQDVHKKKTSLAHEMTETQISQQELHTTTEEFKRLHRERQDLLRQWENAIKTMKQRDETISQHQTEYQKIRDEIQAKRAVLAEKQHFLDMQEETNADIEKKIGMTERLNAKKKSEHTEAHLELVAFQDEVEMIRTTLNKTASLLSSKKVEIANVRQEIDRKNEALESEKSRLEATRERLKQVNESKLSLEQKVQQLSDMLKAEEQTGKDMDRQLKTLKEQEFRKTQELFKYRQEEKNLLAEINGGEVSLKNLHARITQLDEESLKQQELLYNQEFKLQQLERKVRRAQGERTMEEKEQLLKSIDELNLQLEDRQKTITLLNTQFKRAQDDLRNARRRYEGLVKEFTNVNESIAEINLYNESSSNQLAARIREKEELMVEENILKLEARKLRSFLNARADNVLSLENRQVQLQMALEERTKEIEIHKDMLRAHIKIAEEERYSAAAELRERMDKVAKLKRKYEIVMSQFATEDGEEHTQAYYVIKAAQRREALQQEGDALDASIRKMEREIRALENTLRLMNERNQTYRDAVHRADVSSKDLEHKQLLEEQFRAAMEKYRAKRKDIQDLHDEIQHLEKTLHSLSEEETGKLQEVGSLEKKLQALEKDLQEQEQKKQRAHKLCLKLANEWRKAANVPSSEETPEEIDLQIKETRQFNQLIVKKLTEVAERDPLIAEKLKQTFEENGLPAITIHVKPQSRASARSPAGSIGSALSSGRNSVASVQSDVQSVPGSQRSSRPSSRTMSRTTISFPPQPTQQTIQRSGSGLLKNGKPPLPQQDRRVPQPSQGHQTPIQVPTGSMTPPPESAPQVSAPPLTTLPSSHSLSPSLLNTSVVQPVLDVSENQEQSAEQNGTDKKTKPGSGRIKKPSRPGSASSTSTRGSVRSR